MVISRGRLLRRGWLLLAAIVCDVVFIQGLCDDTFAATGHIASVVELFTSQGCSSCPPADRLLTRLAREPDVVAIGFSIDYWDFIGWKDTLASPVFTARQKDYAAARGDGRVYTPQAVIDGLVAAVGSDKKQIEWAIRANRGRQGALSVPMRLVESGDVLHIDVGAGPDVAASVYVLRVVKAKTVMIARGANSGHSVTYTNAVRAIHKIGKWHGAPHSYDLIELKGDGEGYVVLLQTGSENRPGVILAAAKSAGF